MVSLLAATLLAAAPPATAPRVVEEVVAVVRNPPGAPPRLITLTKLEEEALRAALDWLLDQILLSDDAARLGLDQIERGAVEAAAARFRAQLGSAEAYARFLAASELTDEELLATLARMVRVERYVQSRVGRGARVGDEEVDRWLAANGAADAPAPARAAARAQLEEERARAEVHALVAELRGRADVRVLDSLRKDGP